MSKYLKDWKSFLLQEKQLDLFQNTFYEKPELKYSSTEGGPAFWPISIEQVEDLLFELEENGYYIDVVLTFVDGKQDLGPEQWKYGLNERELIPTVGVTIGPKIVRGTEPNQLSDDDLTYVLTSFVNRVKPKFKTIEFYDEDGILNLKDIRIKGGLEYELEKDDIVDISKLFMNLIWYKPVYLTDKMIIEYHNLDDKVDITYDDKEQAYLTYPAEKYAEWLISYKDEYYGILTDKNGLDALWERYWDYSEQVDVETLFQYHLNVDAVKLLVDLLIDDFEQIKEVDEDEYKTLTGVGITAKEQLIERVQKVGLVNVGKLLDEIDPDYISDIRSMWTDMGVSATVDSLQDKIISSLEEIIQNQLETKVTKTEWKDGIPYLTMKFNLNWLERYEGQDEWMGYVIQEYISNNYLDDNNIKVYMDYMEDADHTQFNNDVKSMAINGIERKGRKPITGSDKP
jgi:hypothetical protein